MTDVEEKIGQIQLMQHNLENFSNQRQQFQIEQTETESALAELDKSSTAYRIIGNIMVLSDKELLKKDLEDKRQVLGIRINSIEKQESRIREKAEILQKEIMEELNRKENDRSKNKASTEHRRDN